MAIINGSFASNSKNLQPYIDYSYSQNTDNITTTVTATLYVKKLTSYGNTWSSSTPYSLSIGGTTVDSGRKNVDMRNVGVGASVAVASGSRTISHDSNGNLYVSLNGVVDWTGSNPGKGTVSGGFNPPTIIVNTPPWMSGSLNVSPSGGIAENTQTINLSWSKAGDSQGNANKYVIYRYINDTHNHTIEVGNINTLSTSDNIGWTGQGTKIHYQIWAADTYGVWSNGITSAVIQKNTFTPITLGASGNIYHSTGNQTVTLTRTGGGNTVNGGTLLSQLTARIGSTNITVYNSTAGGNLTIVPGTQTVSNPHIRLGDLRSALSNSSYNGTLTLSLYSRNDWGSDGNSARDIWVDLRTEPIAGGAATSIDSSSYYNVPGVGNIIVPARKRIKLTWGAATDPNGTPITYRVEQQINNGSWTTLTSSTSNTYYEYNVNVSEKPTYKWRVYAKNSYGRETLISGTPSAVLYDYSQPTVNLGATVRTATEFTVTFSTSISTTITGNSIQSITLNYAGKDTSLATGATSVKLTGLQETSTGEFTITVVDKYGATFGVSGSSANGSVPQFYPVLSMRKNGVGINCIPSGNYQLEIRGGSSIDGSLRVTGSLTVNGKQIGAEACDEGAYRYGVHYATDELFQLGRNGLGIYNNAGGGTVTTEVIDDPTAPTSSKRVLKVTTSGNASPGWGGVQWGHPSYASGEWSYIFVAKLPADKYLSYHNNSYGDGASHEWISDNKGTGDWKTYICKAKAGKTGEFSSIGYFATNGGSGNFSWSIAKATYYDNTNRVGEPVLLKNDGGLEIGNYIDFHERGQDLDYNMRIINNGDVCQIQNRNGNVRIGPLNGSYCHYVTDRPSHWFDRDVRVQGEIYCGSDYASQVYNTGNLDPFRRNTDNWFHRDGMYNYLFHMSSKSTGTLVIAPSTTVGGTSGDWAKEYNFYPNGEFNAYKVVSRTDMSAGGRITGSSGVRAGGNGNGNWNGFVDVRNVVGGNYGSAYGTSTCQVRLTSSSATNWDPCAIFELEGIKRVNLSKTSIQPHGDNDTYCATSLHRWAALYAATGTVYSSSIEEKENIVRLDKNPLTRNSRNLQVSYDEIIKKGIIDTNLAVYNYKSINELQKISPRKVDDGDIYVGFIGQEVEKQSPEFFRLIGDAYDKETLNEETGEVVEVKRQYDIREASVIGVLWSGLQQSLKENDELKNEFLRISNENLELKNRLKLIEQKLGII